MNRDTLKQIIYILTPLPNTRLRTVRKRITWIPSVQVIKLSCLHSIMNMLLTVHFLNLWKSKIKETSSQAPYILRSSIHR